MPQKHTSHSINLEEMLNDASIDRILAIDTAWKIISWNRTSEIISGYEKSELLGKDLFEVFPQLLTDADMVRSFELAMGGKKSFLPSKPGAFNRDFYENHFIPLTDAEGNIIGVMNIMHDVAHRVKTEQQLEKLNAELKDKYRQLKNTIAELATFTSITGNELKEPIKKIYTSLEHIIRKEGASLSDSSKASFRRMQASLNRINLLLDDVLALSTIGSFSQEFTQVNSQKILDDVLHDLRNKINEKHAVIEKGELPQIPGSAQMLHYLFYNLIDNALKFQPAGSTPRISITGSLTCAKQSENGTDKKEYICIKVTDNGIGFNNDEKEKIFSMFERLHPKKEFAGAGIGLTVCRKIAEAHGGFIEAESMPGKGSSFLCYLPV